MVQQSFPFSNIREGKIVQKLLPFRAASRESKMHSDSDYGTLHRIVTHEGSNRDSASNRCAPEHPGGRLEIPLTRADLARALSSLELEQKEHRRRIDRLLRYQISLDQRLKAIENSLFFRSLRWIGRTLDTGKRRCGQWLLHSRLHPLYRRLMRPVTPHDRYQAWVAAGLEIPPSRPDKAFRFQPVISVVMPVYNPNPDWLEAAVNSVRGQIYPHWELCICDDASSADWLEPYLHTLASGEPRVRITRNTCRSGISRTLNAAGQLASGDYIGFLDHDDELSPYALHEVVRCLQMDQHDLLYSDEDKLDSRGQRIEPTFKPDWSPVLLTNCMYLGHFLVCSKLAIDRVGWFRPQFDGSQDYDLALRLTDGPVSVRHIPRVLYHWRKHPHSTAESAASKPYTHAAGQAALEDAIRRRGWKAEVSDSGKPNLYRMRWNLDSEPAVSIVICSKNIKLLTRCLDRVANGTDYSSYEVIVVGHTHVCRDDFSEACRAARIRSRVIAYNRPFNFADMNNRGAEAAEGEILVFLNDDTEPLRSDWLRALVRNGMRTEIGAVGALLRYPSGSIQHSGVALGIMAATGHPGRHRYNCEYWPWWELPRNASAVTGACLATRRALFMDLQGFDTSFPVNYNDVDYCLRITAAGFQVVLEPEAALIHRECQSRSPDIALEETERFWSKWHHVLTAGDPFYNPNLTYTAEDASLNL
ncbi:MAG: glycosyltransferase family 2 protein [Bryobacteraceae bacterium]